MASNNQLPYSRVLLFILTLGFLLVCASCGQNATLHEDLNIKVDQDTYWWAGVINHGNQMPLMSAYQADFNSNYGNQVQPLMLSSKGEVIWSDMPYELEY